MIDMLNFEKEQKVVEIGTTRIGGQPGENPVAMVATVFYTNHAALLDEKTGKIDKKLVEQELNDYSEVIEETGMQGIVDVVGGYSEALIKECEYALKHDNPIDRKNEIDFHRIIGSVTGNPILMFILDFVENLLLDAKEILQPSKEFSKKVLKAHKLIYESLLKRAPEKAREEMVKHVEEVAKDLIAIQKERGLQVINLKPDD